MASALQKFLDQAYYWAVTNPAKESGGQNKFKKGSELATIFSLAGASAGTAWCAIFVYACARKAGVHNTLFSKSFYAPGICHNVIKKGGTWIPGPYKTGKKVKPQPGDLILYNDKSSHVTYKSDGSVKAWHGYHVGIVYKVTSTSVITMEGNVSGGRAQKISHKLDAHSIGGYARPKWGTLSTTGTTTNTGGSAVADGPLYKTENDRHDMTLREIGYLDANGKLTKTNTGIKVALINYTSLLGDLYKLFPKNTYGGKTVNLEKLKGNEKIVVNYLLGQGIDLAGACGIAGNIKVDSNYNPATHDSNAWGICKWTGNAAAQMRISAGQTSWATNLSGQLDFLMGDLQDNYASLLKELRTLPNTTAGVNSAAEKFSKTYKKISKTATRVTTAKSIFSNILITAATQVGTKQTSGTCTVIDVSKKPQKALSACYTYFDVNRADSSTIKQWEQSGKSTSYGFCTMGGKYIVAHSTDYNIKVGSSIDLIVSGVGTIHCIVGGAFNDVKTPIQFYRTKDSIIETRQWSVATISQIKDFGVKK